MSRRSPEQEMAVDEAIERLDAIMALRRKNPEMFPRKETVTGVMRCAIVIVSNTLGSVFVDGQNLPGHDSPAHWFESNRNGFSDEG